MKADPSEAVVQYEPGSHRFFREVLRVDPVVFETIKVESALLEFDDGHLGLALRFYVPIKVKLPGGHWLR